MGEGIACDTEGGEAPSSQFCSGVVTVSTANSEVAALAVSAALVLLFFLYSVVRRYGKFTVISDYHIIASGSSKWNLNAFGYFQAFTSHLRHRRSSVCCDVHRSFPLKTAHSESPMDPLLHDSKEDAFFTWDSGGNTNEYSSDSFVHTAVELPKYQGTCANEDDREMLLYAQDASQMCNDVDASFFVVNRPELTDRIEAFRDYSGSGGRGYLETILEENSDDMRSPSECDESSFGWGSWDESDDDRVTVVEMQTANSQSLDYSCNGSKHDLLFGDAEQFTTDSPSTQRRIRSDSQADKDTIHCLFSNVNADKAKKQPNVISCGVKNCEDNLCFGALETRSGFFSSRTDSDASCESLTLVPANTEHSTEVINYKKYNCSAPSNITGSLPEDSQNTTMDNCTDCSFLASVSSDSSPYVQDVCSEATRDCGRSQSFRNYSDSFQQGLAAEDYSGDFSLPSFPDDMVCVYSDRERPSSANIVEDQAAADVNVCLVPSKTQETAESNSNEFKDYFLPAERYVPFKINRAHFSDAENGKTIAGSSSSVSHAVSPDVIVQENSKIRCLSIGFDDRNTTTSENYFSSKFDECSILVPCTTSGSMQVPWCDTQLVKEPETPTIRESRAEALLPTIKSNGGELTMPPREDTSFSEYGRENVFDEPASDDERREVACSLSRWQHHGDLQKLEEITSPISRWRHHPHFEKMAFDDTAPDCAPRSSDEEDFVLPEEELINIYSSSRMADKKMSRIKIKGGKKIKNLGLWESETKVTLPPFTTDQKFSSNFTCNLKEELDDLELEMFASSRSGKENSRRYYKETTNSLEGEENLSLENVARKPFPCQKNIKNSKSLESFQGGCLCTESTGDYKELSLTKRSKSSVDLMGEDIYNELMEISFLESVKLGETENFLKSDSANHDDSDLKVDCNLPEGSETCPLCKETDLAKLNKIIPAVLRKSHSNNDLLNLLDSTYNEITGSEVLRAAEYQPRSTDRKHQILESPSPITSSDSDEGVANLRQDETKKRIKKRVHGKNVTENKHDDSGYVEDDEDDDEDDIPEEESLQLSESLANRAEKRATAESCSNQDQASNNLNSSQGNDDFLQKQHLYSSESRCLSLLAALCSEEPRTSKDGQPYTDEVPCCKTDEKCSVPNNLSTFSTWLLDKELTKIASKDLVEKLIVSDILSLREQTVMQLLNRPPDLKTDSKRPCGTDSNSFPDGSSHSDIKFVNSSSKDKNACITQVKHENITATEDSNTSSSRGSTLLSDCRNGGEGNELRASCSVKPRQDESCVDDKKEEELTSNGGNREDKTSINYNQVPGSHVKSSSQVTVTDEKGSLDAENISGDLFKDQPLNPNVLEDYDVVEERNRRFAASDNNVPFRGNSEDTNERLVLPSKGESLDCKVEEQRPGSAERHLPEATCNLPRDPVNKVSCVDQTMTGTFSPNDNYGEDSVLPRDNYHQAGVGLTASFFRQCEDVLESKHVHEVSDNIAAGCSTPPLQLDFQSSVAKDLFAIGVTGTVRDASTTDEQSLVKSDHERELQSDSSLKTDTSCDISVDFTASESYELNSAGREDASSILGLVEDSGSISTATEIVTSEHENDSARDYDSYDISSVQGSILNSESPSVGEDKVRPCEESANDDEDSGKPDSGISTEFDLAGNGSLTVSRETSYSEELTSFRRSRTLSEPDINEEKGERGSKRSSKETIARRSRSLVRREDIDESREELNRNKQSKSSPDLRECGKISQPLSSGQPLSALLSKSVSQRIQDYLDQKDRCSVLNRSLPPNERSRHYRRICVSTETVAERAARFESRNRSASSNSSCPQRPSTLNSRGGEPRSDSCPPFGVPTFKNTNNHTCVRAAAMTSSLSGRNEGVFSHQARFSVSGKPMATVKPSVGAHSSLRGDQTGNKTIFTQKLKVEDEKKRMECKDDFVERITAYSKASSLKSPVLHKPPLPPTQGKPPHHTAVLKGRIASARRDFFERLGQQQKQQVSAEKENEIRESTAQSEDCRNSFDRLDVFRRSAREERARLAASHPDLGALEAAVRSSRRRIDALKKNNNVAGKSAPLDFNKLDAGASSRPDRDFGSSSGGDSSKRTATTALPNRAPIDVPYRRCTGEIAWASCARRLREAAEKEQQRKSLSQGYLETDIDSHEQRPAGPLVDGSVRARSLLALREALAAAAAQHRGEDEDDEEEARDFDDDGTDRESVAITGGEELLHCRARSMDFLLDEHNRERALPPENQLGSGQGRVKSEHELRVERSLQNLTVPDWYKRSAWSTKPKEGFILRRGSEGAASEAATKRRWKGFSSSRTPSASSLSSNSYAQRSVIIPKRITVATSTDWRYGSSLMSSRESLPPASPASLSPRDCGTFQYSSLSRWSSSRLSTGSVPSSSWTVSRSFRQPYLGWRAAAASSAQTPTSAGSRSSPGISPAASSPLYGSRPVSPRRPSQEHAQHSYHQAQVTSSATLRPDAGDSQETSRISPLALYDNANGVFFGNDNVIPQYEDSRACDEKLRAAGAWPVLRRDRYSYTQSLYNPGVLLSPNQDDDGHDSLFLHQQDVHRNLADEEKNKILRSPQLPPRVWMESSFVGTKKAEAPESTVRNVRNVTISQGQPSTSFIQSPATSSVRSSCAPTKQMDTKELIEHLHSFLRNLQDRPMPTVSAFSYKPDTKLNGVQDGSTAAQGEQEAEEEDKDDQPDLVEYDSEPKAYPRGAWRHSRGSSANSKDPSPASSTDNELWTSVCDDVIGRGRVADLTDPMDSSHSVSPASPPPAIGQQPFHMKKSGLDDTSGPPIFFASSRRGSKCSSENQQQHPAHFSSSSRRSSRSESEGQRDSRSGSSSLGTGRRDSRATLDSSSATGRDRDSKSASLEEVLDSLLAIPTSSRSSSPTSPRRSAAPSWQQKSNAASSRPTSSASPTSLQDDSYMAGRAQEDSGEENGDSKARKARSESVSKSVGTQNQENMDFWQDRRQQGKTFDDVKSVTPLLPPNTTTTTTTTSSSTTAHLPPTPAEEVDSEVNPGSFCRSPSPDEDEKHYRSSTSMEVLVPEGEEQEVSSYGDDDVNLVEDFDIKESVEHRETSPVARPSSPCPSCNQMGDTSIPCFSHTDEELCVNPFVGLEPGSYCRGVAEGRQRHSLCLVLLHLPCMFCARTIAPPSANTFQYQNSHDPTRITSCSEPSTPTRTQVPGMTDTVSTRSCGDGFTHGDVRDNRVTVPRVTRQPTPATYDPFLTDLSVVGSDPGHERAKGSGPATKASTIADDSTPRKSGKGKPSGGSCAGTNSSHLKCHRPKCTKSLPVEEARAKFRTCPNCYTYYCSRQCRKLHFSRHKDQCPHTRISNLCKQVLMKARDDHVSRRHLSLCAKRGLLSRGRGAVKLLFLCPEDALDYLVHGWENSKGQTLYVSRSDLLPQEMGSDVFSQVRSFCDKYNPERKFILLAAITVTSDAAAAKGTCRDREIVVRGAKMHLSPSLPEDDVQTLILTLTNESQAEEATRTTMEERKKAFDCVLEQLDARGVDLEKCFPDVYQKMVNFVEKDEPFVPVSIFPTDKRSGHVFMCIILPWADADIIGNISAKASTAKCSKKRWIR